MILWKSLVQNLRRAASPKRQFKECRIIPNLPKRLYVLFFLTNLISLFSSCHAVSFILNEKAKAFFVPPPILVNFFPAYTEIMFDAYLNTPSCDIELFKNSIVFRRCINMLMGCLYILDIFSWIISRPVLTSTCEFIN